MYDIEQLMELTGYKKNTLYNLCNDLDIDGIKGKISGNPGKSLYSEQALLLIYKYQGLLIKHSRKDAIRIVLEGKANGS